MPSHADPEKCTGCGECQDVCPEEAISMSEDNKPVVDDEKCIDCGICIVRCPSQARDVVELLRMFT